MSRTSRRVSIALALLLASALGVLWLDREEPRARPGRAATPATTASARPEERSEARGGSIDKSRNVDASAVPVKQAPAAIAGVVVDAEGVPVAGASIAIAGSDDRSARTLTSDAAGGFEATAMEAGTWRLTAWKDALASTRVEVVAAPGAKVDGVTLRLDAAAALLVTVRDAADGNSLSVCHASPLGSPPQPCDHAGRVRLSPLAAGTLVLRVSAPNFAPRELEVNVAPRASLKLDVSLARGASLSGVVKDPDGKPLAGAQVWTKHYALNAVAVVESRANTDGKGRFELAGVDPGRVTVRAQADGYAETASDELRVGPGEHRDGLSLTLTTGGAIAGTVARLGGEPVATATVRALKLNDRSIAATDTTATDGSFRLDGLQPGDYTVVAEFGSARALAPGTSVTAREETQVTLLLGDDVVDGVVVDDAGAAIPNALVTAWSAYAGGQGGASTSTDRDGHFRFEGLVGSPFRLEAKVTDRAPGEARGVMPGTPARIVLASAGRLEGVVTDESGRGLEDFVLTISPTAPAAGAVGSRFRVLRLLSPDGSFVVEGLPQGHYEVRAAANGRRAASVEADVGSRATRVALKLERGLLLAGKVLFEGAPAAGCDVQEARRSTTFARADAALTAALTDAQGTFRLAGLEKGRRPIWTVCPGGIGTWFEIDLTGDKTDMVIKVVKTHHAEGDDFAGIAATLQADGEGRVFVAAVAEGGPAFLAGITSGDELVAVDTWPVAGHPLREVIDRIRGPLGMPVALDVRRTGSPVVRLVAERARVVTN